MSEVYTCLKCKRCLRTVRVEGPAQVVSGICDECKVTIRRQELKRPQGATPTERLTRYAVNKLKLYGHVVREYTFPRHLAYFWVQRLADGEVSSTHELLGKSVEAAADALDKKAFELKTGVRTIGWFAISRAQQYRTLAQARIKFWKDESALRAHLRNYLGYSVMDPALDDVQGFIHDTMESDISKFASDYKITEHQASEALDYFAATSGTDQELYRGVCRALGLPVNF